MPLTAAKANPPEAVRAHLGRVLDLDGMPFAALNAAFWSEGCLISLDDGCVLSRPIHLVSIAAGGDAPAMFAPLIGTGWAFAGLAQHLEVCAAGVSGGILPVGPVTSDVRPLCGPRSLHASPPSTASTRSLRRS